MRLDSRFSTFYARLMITRYSRPEMRAIWTDENRLRLWLQIELLAGEALARQGIVPRADFAKINRGAEKWFADLPGLVARQKELEKTLNHDVIGFTTAVAEKIHDRASRWFHFGLTSSDIIDTAFAVQMMQSADILIGGVKTLRKSIAAQARKYKFTPCVGRSHGIHAEPTTFGLKLALMYDEFGRALERLERVRETVGRRETFRRRRHQRTSLAASRNVRLQKIGSPSCPHRHAGHSARHPRRIHDRAGAGRREHRTLGG